ncbi:MAG: hypothetical protein H5U40_13480 [Polyangiaceae bacterium]|nr:hypothetical protein [Polyangiaceae bacterium]
MPVSGLVITRAPDVANATLRVRLGEVPGLELGPASEARFAATLVSDDVERHDAALEQLAAVAGVLFVELAFHDLSDVERYTPRPRRSRSRGDSDGTT